MGTPTPIPILAPEDNPPPPPPLLSVLPLAAPAVAVGFEFRPPVAVALSPGYEYAGMLYAEYG